MIECGWCGRPTSKDGDRCASCSHVDPQRPWVQRDQAAPVVRTDATGRPAVDRKTVRARLADARTAVGPGATVERLAEWLDVSPRTVRRWQQVAG